MIKIGIIGCGNIGSKRALAIKNHTEMEIKIIIGPKKHGNKCSCRGLELSKIIGCEYHDNWKKMLSMDIDAVFLSTPTKYFEEIGTAVLNSGKHLLVEKPLGINLEQAQKITGAAKKNKKILKTGFNLRFDDGLQKVKNLVDKRELGEIYFIKITYVNGAVLTNNNDVGSLFDIGTHSINLTQWLIKDKSVDQILVDMQSKEFSKDDNGFIILRRKELLASIHFSFLRWENQFNLEVSGSKGFINLNSLPKWGKQTLTLGERVYPSGMPKLTQFNFDTENSWKRECEYFINCIKGNVSDYNVEEGYQTMKLTEEIHSKAKISF